jgi:hypothetical protein
MAWDVRTDFTFVSLDVPLCELHAASFLKVLPRKRPFSDHCWN